MSIFIETSQLQDDLSVRENYVTSVVKLAHALAAHMNSGRQEFWALPNARLLASLNADVQTSVQTRELMDDLSAAINAILDEAVADRPELASQLSVRAPIGYGRADVVFNPAALEFQIIP